jgi:protein SCO1
MMKSLKYLQNSGLLLAFCTIIACQSPAIKQSRVEKLPYYNSPEFTPHWFDSADSLVGFHQISPFKLLNQDGDTITEKTFEGKVYVTDFFFTTCPGICPKMTTNLAIVQDAFINDDAVLLLSHSVMPDVDSVSTLKKYALAKGVKSHKWHLVTGERNQIYKLGRKDYFVEEDLGVEKTEDEFLHTENFVLIDKKRYIRGIYNGLNEASVQQLIADIKTLEKE